MKALVIFYSRTGTTKKLALAIADELKADYEEIIDLKDRSGIMGWLASGKDAMKKKITSIKEIKRDIESYGLVIFGSPVWAGSIAPAIRTFLINNQDKLKKVAFFCTMGGNNPSKTFLQMQELSSIPISTLALSTKEVRNDLYKDKLSNYITEIKTGGTNGWKE